MRMSNTSMVLMLTGIFALSCQAQNEKTMFELAGSTPGDTEIKAMTGIDQNEKIDFIKWTLLLDGNEHFELDLHYGESKSNTMGFIADGKHQKIKGNYEKIPASNSSPEIIRLKTGSPAGIRLLQLSEHVYHILDASNRMLNGNGGWSYSLFHKGKTTTGEILKTSPQPDLSSKQLVFDGRTPCQSFAKAYAEMKVSADCFKLKWKLTLNRKNAGDLHGSCIIRNIVGHTPRDMTTSWELIKNDKGQWFYKIMDPRMKDAIQFFLADENVLLFVDPNLELFIGNEDFGFALNKRQIGQ